MNKNEDFSKADLDPEDNAQQEVNLYFTFESSQINM